MKLKHIFALFHNRNPSKSYHPKKREKQNINFSQIASIIKPILKSKNSFMKDSRKKVPFSQTVQFCY